jgi:hypothetical protein
MEPLGKLGGSLLCNVDRVPRNAYGGCVEWTDAHTGAAAYICDGTRLMR